MNCRVAARVCTVTLVLSVHGRDTMWLLTDRRLSYGPSRPPVDNAVKVLELGTTDGIALLGYAGLGATARGTQPSTWMSAVLRGRPGLTLEQALGVLSDAAIRELPRHMAAMPFGAHTILASAYLNGVGPRTYTVDNVIDPLTRQHFSRYTRHVPPDPGPPAPRVALAGTGGIFLTGVAATWERSLLRLVKAHDNGKVRPRAVADELARLNVEAHKGVRDGSVGPRCIVVWRRRLDASRPGEGGGHLCYTETTPEAEMPPLPAIQNGMDLQALVDISMKASGAVDKDGRAQWPPQLPEEGTFERLIAERSWDPDDTLP